MNDVETLITLNQLPKVGPKRIRSLMAHFGSGLDLLNASPDQIAQVPQCGGEIAQIISNWEYSTHTQRELDECEQLGIQILTEDSPSWPAALTHSPDAPVVLYVKGSLCPTADTKPIAVIGSRKTTNYGRNTTHQFSSHLASAGHTILSGLALGIDTIAHQAALQQQARTIAVIGSGLCHMYPRENTELAQEIAQNGAVVSEYPLHTHPSKQTFPQRNRIVAQWASATLVTEMPERSGAMITAQFARAAGRPVYAIPGPIDRPSSAGCHLLIREGAHLVTHPQQITQDLSPQVAQLDLALDSPAPDSPPPSLSPHESQVYSALSSQEQSLEELLLLTQLDVPTLSAALFHLEMQSLAKQHPGMTYTRA